MSEFNPLGSGAGIVDQRLGNAYQVVKHVADNLDAINMVAALADDASIVKNNFAIILAGVSSFRATYAEAITAFAVDSYFTSAASGQLRLYKRISTTPFYADQGDVVAPVSKALLLSSGGAALIGTINPGAGAVARTQQAKNNDIVNAKDFGAVGDGVADDAPAIQLAIQYALATKRELIVPAGTYRLNSQLTAITTSTTTFTDGLRLIGAGSDKTVFDCRYAGHALKIDTNAVGVARFQRGIRVQGITFTGALGSVVTSSAIFLCHSYSTIFTDVRINSFVQDGIYIPVNEGDTDGCVNTRIDNSYITFCKGWGINVDCLPGHNECSYLTLDNTLVALCGVTTGAYPPTSGGIRWKGQYGTFQNGGMTECGDGGFYCYGSPGLAIGLSFHNWTWENCYTRSFVCSGINGLIFDNVDLRTNSMHSQTDMIYLDSTSYLIDAAVFKGLVVYADAAITPITIINAIGNNGYNINIGYISYRVPLVIGQVSIGAGVYGFANPTIADAGSIRFAPASPISVIFTTANPTYAPDIRQGAIHRIRFNTGMTGTATIGNPISGLLPGSAEDGAALTLVIYNNTAALVNLSYGLGTKGAPSTLAAGASVTGRWLYDNAVGWVQSQAWF